MYLIFCIFQSLHQWLETYAVTIFGAANSTITLDLVNLTLKEYLRNWTANNVNVVTLTRCEVPTLVLNVSKTANDPLSQNDSYGIVRMFNSTIGQLNVKPGYEVTISHCHINGNTRPEIPLLLIYGSSLHVSESYITGNKDGTHVKSMFIKVIGGEVVMIENVSFVQNSMACSMFFVDGVTYVGVTNVTFQNNQVTPCKQINIMLWFMEIEYLFVHSLTFDSNTVKVIEGHLLGIAAVSTFLMKNSDFYNNSNITSTLIVDFMNMNHTLQIENCKFLNNSVSGSLMEVFDAKESEMYHEVDIIQVVVSGNTGQQVI